MASTLKIDRDAFRRGVEDVMTLAPLREAVKHAGGVLMGRHADAKQSSKSVSTTPDTSTSTRAHDVKAARR